MLDVTSVFPPGTGPAPGSAHERYVADRLAEVGLWGTATLAEVVRGHALRNPDGAAFIAEGERLTWREFDRQSDVLAARLAEAGSRSSTCSASRARSDC